MKLDFHYVLAWRPRCPASASASERLSATCPSGSTSWITRWLRLDREVGLTAIEPL
jgi:hypothetical protein